MPLAAASRKAVAADDHRAPRSVAALLLLALLALTLFAGFVALGTWQVHRRSWKLDLIARVDQRLHAAAVSAPERGQWPTINRDRDEYRHVVVDGELLNDHETFVQAVTEHGPGFWLLTPLRTREGSVVLINRGFVDARHRAPDTRVAAQFQGSVHVSGLLRFSEPGGAFLRHNDPAAHRWYSRDVAAIATAQGLPAADVAPYFIDADERPNPGGWPIGGLTVVHFHNSHLIYAITWYTLALMVAGAAFGLGRYEWRLRQGGAGES
ncbi:SURF1 family protein [Solimonas terrae]|uniref:SURF1-like protein n=1 Tax=Solimonas terrae TaxID=1396819 RepID=A0A6M2BPB8_9GAMM|nr:SURF1 family protein [Solimonas terrae]NGY04214.1 SURF1 family protein [Solimonas terrae]